jgi:hypothetical protein
MYTLYAAFCIVTGSAKVWVPRATRVACGTGTRTAHSRDYQIAHLHPTDRWTDFNHLTECLMADHQIVGTLRGCTVFKGAYLLICATNAHIKHAYFDMIGFSYMWSFMLDELDFVGVRENCDGFHVASFHNY